MCALGKGGFGGGGGIDAPAVVWAERVGEGEQTDAGAACSQIPGGQQILVPMAMLRQLHGSLGDGDDDDDDEQDEDENEDDEQDEDEDEGEDEDEDEEVAEVAEVAAAEGAVEAAVAQAEELS